MKKSIKVMLLLFAFSTLIILLYYINLNKRINCINNIRENATRDSLSKIIVKQLIDSVVKWKNNNVLKFSFYGTSENWYFDDLVLFNKNRNRAYSFYYMSPKDTSAAYSSIQLYVAEYKRNIWKYYLADMPSIGYFKYNNNGKIVTIQQLIEKTNVQLAKHLKMFKCEFEDDLVDKWFKDIEDLKYMENKFWKEEYEKKRKRDSIANLNNGR